MSVKNLEIDSENQMKIDFRKLKRLQNKYYQAADAYRFADYFLEKLRNTSLKDPYTASEVATDIAKSAEERALLKDMQRSAHRKFMHAFEECCEEYDLDLYDVLEKLNEIILK